MPRALPVVPGARGSARDDASSGPEISGFGTLHNGVDYCDETYSLRNHFPEFPARAGADERRFRLQLERLLEGHRLLHGLATAQLRGAGGHAQLLRQYLVLADLAVQLLAQQLVLQLQDADVFRVLLGLALLLALRDALSALLKLPQELLVLGEQALDLSALLLVVLFQLVDVQVLSGGALALRPWVRLPLELGGARPRRGHALRLCEVLESLYLLPAVA